MNWSHRGAYMQERHGITPRVADDALGDPNRVVLDPDYHSTSGRSIRVIIGFSALAKDIITVIVLADEGIRYGVNGWVANDKDRRLYRAGREGGSS